MTRKQIWSVIRSLDYKLDDSAMETWGWGYQVDVGIVPKRERNADGKQEWKQLEIDFVANMGSRRYYIQSALSLSDEEKIRKEKASLLNVNDSFKKGIIVKDVINVQRDEDGITTMSIYDFLLNENSLEM